jgi:TetR/AcrR family transcriptional regulator, transcriptional repressor for nem operon
MADGGPKGRKKQETRALVLEAAERGFKQHGYAGVGVDGIAREAGVTSGAFYAHFGSKTGAFQEALEAGLDATLARLPEFRREHGETWPAAFADYYLGASHRADLACGCAMAALTGEVMRGTDESRVTYQERMQRIAGIVAGGLAGESDAEARAWGFLSILIGGLTVIRAMPDGAQADAVAGNVRQMALAIAGPGRR